WLGSAPRIVSLSIAQPGATANKQIRLARRDRVGRTAGEIRLPPPQRQGRIWCLVSSFFFPMLASHGSLEARLPIPSRTVTNLPPWRRRRSSSLFSRWLEVEAALGGVGVHQLDRARELREAAGVLQDTPDARAGLRGEEAPERLQFRGRDLGARHLHTGDQE